MTLMVLDLNVPAKHAIQTDQALLGERAPRFVVFLMIFLTLGIFRVGQHTQPNHPVRGNRHLTWIHLAFLFAISVMPICTALMAEFFKRLLFRI